MQRRPRPHDPQRRRWLALALAAPWTTSLARDEQAARVLRAGGAVAVFRHANAPGVYDPPGMTLADCSTQRNLDDQGRRQAQALGAWFREQGLQPRQVLTSPWCRCRDTATGAFGRAEAWAPLGSPTGRAEGDRRALVRQLRESLATPRPGVFDVWVTHNFVIGDLTGISTASGEGLVLRADAAGTVEVLARIAAP